MVKVYQRKLPGLPIQTQAYHTLTQGQWGREGGEGAVVHANSVALHRKGAHWIRGPGLYPNALCNISI